MTYHAYHRTLKHHYKQDCLSLVGVFVLAILLAGLFGCTASYKHLSDPRISNDGYDLVCGGVELGDNLTASVDVCHNIRGGELIHAELQYKWSN